MFVYQHFCTAIKSSFWLLVFLFQFFLGNAQPFLMVDSTYVDSAWAGNSVNTVIFRRNSLTSNDTLQFTAFYNKSGEVVLGRRKLNSKFWDLKSTGLFGKYIDAHNAISIQLDGNGYLHLAWNHHNDSLHYVRSIHPCGLELSAPLAMTSKNESKVTYPEFYALANGDLIFLYRDGESGSGNLVMNRYHTASGSWSRINDQIIDGENIRSPYWQFCIDNGGNFHLSWVWRETWDVSTNHDLCYAHSTNGGITWKQSNGVAYTLPITAEKAEIIKHIPQGSELINQTSITTDTNQNPFIIGYWREKPNDFVQYHVVYFRNGNWLVKQLSDRKTDFTLSGGGTKRIPISRPQVFILQKPSNIDLLFIYRDEELGNTISVGIFSDFPDGNTIQSKIYPNSVGQWEPTVDNDLWKRDGKISLFVQPVEQGDAEGYESNSEEPVFILDWDPKIHLK